MQVHIQNEQVWLHSHPLRMKYNLVTAASCSKESRQELGLQSDFLNKELELSLLPGFTCHTISDSKLLFEGGLHTGQMKTLLLLHFLYIDVALIFGLVHTCTLHALHTELNFL